MFLVDVSRKQDISRRHNDARRRGLDEVEEEGGDEGDGEVEVEWHGFLAVGGPGVSLVLCRYKNSVLESQERICKRFLADGRRFK